MFPVMGLFALFVRLGKPMPGVPVLFATAVFAAGVLGWIVAVLFAEPMNLWLRRRTGAGVPSLEAPSRKLTDFLTYVSAP